MPFNLKCNFLITCDVGRYEHGNIEAIPILDMPELEVQSKSTKYKACLVELKTQIYNKASAMC